MLLKIIQTGDDTLRKNAKKLSTSDINDVKTQQLIDLMIATLRDKPGVGLAAPQVGESLQIIVIEDKKQYQDQLPDELLVYQKRKPVMLKVFINPTIKVLDADEDYFFEGCLSVDGYRALVPRAKKITISGLDRNGKPLSMNAEGWLARIMQHEVDHLGGKLYVDMMHAKSFIAEKYFADNWAKASSAKIARYVTTIRASS